MLVLHICNNSLFFFDKYIKDILFLFFQYWLDHTKKISKQVKGENVYSVKSPSFYVKCVYFWYLLITHILCPLECDLKHKQNPVSLVWYLKLL